MDSSVSLPSGGGEEPRVRVAQHGDAVGADGVVRARVGGEGGDGVAHRVRASNQGSSSACPHATRLSFVRLLPMCTAVYMPRVFRSFVYSHSLDLSGASLEA